MHSDAFLTLRREDDFSKSWPVLCRKRGFCRLSLATLNTDNLRSGQSKTLPVCKPRGSDRSSPRVPAKLREVSHYRIPP